jgi:alanyl-tRNA synthetase
MLGYALADTQPTKNCTLVAAFGTDVNKKGLLAGKFIGAIAKICGGGGKPNLAQAGGRDSNKLGDAIAQAKNELISGLG